MTRRDMLRLGSGVLAAFAAGDSAWSEAEHSGRSAADALDHVMVGTADLDAGIAWFEKVTGVRPAIGGVHPGRGTRNALASLGSRHYLELIAPDPLQKTGDNELLTLIRSCTTPRPLQWAASSHDIAATAGMVARAGIKADAPRPGSRTRPDGRVLRWTTLGLDDASGLLPFFIHWNADSVHPSEDAPTGCTLTGVSFESPDPEKAARELRSIGIRAEVSRGAQPRIRVSLKTTRGPVEI